MISLKKQTKGFTIVELLIVIVVIGILSAIVISTYSGIRAKSRNATRQTDINSIQTQLESFYSQNQYYPSLKDMNSASWRASNMKSLTASSMEDPSGKYLTGVVLLASPSAKIHEYAYSVSNSGASCESNDTTCNQYTLTAVLEPYSSTLNSANEYQKSNLD